MDGPGIDPFQSRSCEVDPWESDSQRTNSQDMMWWCSVVVFFVGLLSLRKRMLKRPHQGNAGRHGSWLLALGSWLFLCQGDAFGQLASLGLRGKRPSATGSFQEIHWHPPRVRLDVFDTETRIGAKTSGPVVPKGSVRKRIPTSSRAPSCAGPFDTKVMGDFKYRTMGHDPI